MTNEFYHLFTFICHLYVSLAIATLLLLFGCILVSEDCHSKVPFTGQLKITDIYCFTVWRLEVQNQVADKATVPLKPIRENPSFPLTSWWLAGNPCHCLVCSCNTSRLCLYHHMALSLRYLFSSFFNKDSMHTDLKFHLTLVYDLISTVITIPLMTAEFHVCFLVYKMRISKFTLEQILK